MRVVRGWMTVRRLLLLVAVLAVALAGVDAWTGAPERRARRLAAARGYREYESRFRTEAGLFEACATKHQGARGPSRSCAICNTIVYRWMRAPDGRAVETIGDEAAALQQAADLYAKVAGRLEHAAAWPWLDPEPLSPADRTAWERVNSGHGPVSMKFFEVQ